MATEQVKTMTITINAATIYLAHTFLPSDADRCAQVIDYVWIERKHDCWTINALNGHSLGSFMLNRDKHVCIEDPASHEVPNAFGIRLTKDQLKLIKPTKTKADQENIRITINASNTPQEAPTITIETAKATRFTAERSPYPAMDFEKFYKNANGNYEKGLTSEGSAVSRLPFKAINLFNFSSFFEGGTIPVFKKSQTMTVISFDALEALFEFIGICMQCSFKDGSTDADVAKSPLTPSWAC